jgi:hypothetical protein
MVSNGFWHIVSIVKEQDLPVQQKGNEQLNEYTDAYCSCQHSFDDFHKNPQRLAISLHHATMRQEFRPLLGAALFGFQGCGFRSPINGI